MAALLQPSVTHPTSSSCQVLTSKRRLVRMQCMPSVTPWRCNCDCVEWLSLCPPRKHPNLPIRPSPPPHTLKATNQTLTPNRTPPYPHHTNTQIHQPDPHSHQPDPHSHHPDPHSHHPSPNALPPYMCMSLCLLWSLCLSLPDPLRVCSPTPAGYLLQ